MVELTSGKITIDGLDISTIPRSTIRERIISLSQDPYSLTGSARLNVDPLNEVPDDEIISALQKVQLWDVILSKGGLDAEMNSGLLSHGQRQLFCLARAMLRNSSILVLDEPTSRYKFSRTSLT